MKTALLFVRIYIMICSVFLQEDKEMEFMTIQTDFHIHSDFSADSHSSMESMIQEGIRLGLKTMCFTEHLDLDFPYEDISFDLDIPGYPDL